ncbi:proline--tRNA ligase [Ignicoccus hospitalis]|uniref:Proline--tRNA ligase n=1 Tax=Ignicoccus hospitalis (strain KIN4/I / DSM 18386 / JCM 14125) TaxID=453591 RepID=SYP_IGNH4|nr:proline--tRNA ligase [Ignicoccus hospitalis]A8A9E3.1 RecName: Full=Proline--tRNA ligase; AltName: Full=Prolyl-tRNA synthetase; Short=ProRS [Ignicoccus hospitalis KIN4/I]ABU81545.1 prolyl-tRNA synthetase [Ignicoccus hospitalis KIN4/I]HIH90480.1 proline--tRNA ligase [Desulfurococcaceae archaeon]
MKLNKEENFSEWFDTVLRESGLYDYGRYPVKGMGVWPPFGFKLRKLVLNIIRDLLDSTGHEEVLFPVLIPKTLLEKESEHIRGFEGEVFWVTKGGHEDLDVPLALRPTSETAISYMESFWISSYKQLPMKLYQIVPVYRYETKATRPLIRLREVSTFKEAHTAHESFEGADSQCAEAIEIYKKVFDRLGIPYMISQRPPWDKFAGALYTVAFDTVMPDGRVLQIGTVHHLGQNFSVPFEVRFHTEDGDKDYVWQTSYGLSDRVIASLVAVHGDERGLVLPPEVAPVQVVIVPIPQKEEEQQRKVLEEAKRVEEELKARGWRTVLDDRDELTPGAKYYEWELKGVPFRIEIGKKEVEGDELTVARRDLKKRVKVKKGEIHQRLKEMSDDMLNNMRERAWSFMKSRIKRVRSLEEAKELVEKRYVVELPWCGSKECGLRVDEEVGRVLGVPLDEDAEAKGERCAVCGREAKWWIRVAKTY